MLPRPGPALSAQMRPPSASTKARATGSPIPEPPPLVSRLILEPPMPQADPPNKAKPVVAGPSKAERARAVQAKAQQDAAARAAKLEQQAKFDAQQKKFAERAAKGGHKGWGKKGQAPAKS